MLCRNCKRPIPRAPKGAFTPGYGWARPEPQGAHGPELPVCYGCCAIGDARAMVETGRHDGLYLTSKPHPSDPSRKVYEVTNWPGSLRFIVRGNPRHGHHHCWGHGNAPRVDAWFNGPDGHIWHAIVRGDMDLARTRRTRELAKGGR